MMDVSTIMPSPVGDLRLAASATALVGVVWRHESPGEAPTTTVTAASDHAILAETRRQLDEYFAGKRRAFDLPLDFRGTDFQRRVWAALLTIPFGETRSYGELAKAIGSPGASRAVGAANGRNPISIIAPCHRVIGHDGSLTGFGGGIENKAFLLDLEQAPRLI